jgi:hypothetical protein
MSTPGAKMSRHDPKLEEGAFVSSVAVAPAVMTSLAEAGETPQASLFTFPPAATTTIPALTAFFAALLRARITLGTPRLMLMTALFEPARFDRLTAQSIPAIISAIVPEPQVLTAIKLAFLAIPYLAPPTVPKIEMESQAQAQTGTR